MDGAVLISEWQTSATLSGGVLVRVTDETPHRHGASQGARHATDAAASGGERKMRRGAHCESYDSKGK